jgi:hypothetical protein
MGNLFTGVMPQLRGYEPPTNASILGEFRSSW